MVKIIAWICLILSLILTTIWFILSLCFYKGIEFKVIDLNVYHAMSIAICGLILGVFGICTIWSTTKEQYV